MARIQTYELDSTLSITDKFLGTNDLGETKNFNVDNIILFLNESSRLQGAVSARFSYKLHSGSPEKASIGFTVDKGSTQAFSGLTQIMVSKFNALDVDLTNLYDQMPTTTIIIQQAKDASVFAIFGVTDSAQNGTYSEFYDLDITHKKSSGSLVEDEDYFISILSVSDGDDKNFVFTQGSPETTWTVNHNLNKNPSVTVVNSANNVVYGEVEYITANQVVLTFSDAFSGKAFFN